MEDRRTEILQSVKQAILELNAEAEVILFGSRARGDQREDSDWDFLILTPESADLKVEQAYRHKLFELELEYEEAFSTFVVSKSDWLNKYSVTPLYKSIQEEGIEV